MIRATEKILSTNKRAYLKNVNKYFVLILKYSPVYFFIVKALVPLSKKKKLSQLNNDFNIKETIPRRIMVFFIKSSIFHQNI
jgi:hypothetical protein